MRNFGALVKALIVLVVLCGFAQAGELWSLSQGNYRSYLSVERTNSGLYLRRFSQNKGEFQSLLSATKFKTLKDLKRYVEDVYPDYEAVASLPFWPIKKIEDTNQDKGWGSKKNTYIWLAKNQWDDEWERKYGVWLSTITPDFYKKYKIQTDCADALVGLRWIFARMNALPVANTVADSENLFGNFSIKKEWKKYDTAENWYEDELFLAALDYIMNLTSTRTVINDGFPISIDRKGLIPGTYIITQNSGSGHAKIITETHYDEVTELPLFTLASTSPRAVRLLTREVFLDQDWPEPGAKEILAFRWPVVVKGEWVLQAKNARPAYSLEQFDDGLKSEFPAFIQFVLSRVKGSYDPLKLVEMGISDILGYADQRIQIVKNGYEYCRKNNCKPGSEGDDDWGTPSRDSKLLKKFHDIDTLVKEFENLSPGLYDRWMAGLRNATIVVEGVTLKLSSLRFIMENNLFSSVPTDTPSRRWGLNAPELLTKWMARVEQLLKDRNDLIIRPESPCSGFDCKPKTILWVGLSTYQIDAELNQLFTEVNTYCTLIDSKSCDQYFASSAQKMLSYNGQTQSLQNWFKLIPYYHSDPRVESDRRWGALPLGIQARVLPYFDTVKISKNSLALLDETKILNLSNGKMIYEADKDSRIVLTSRGTIFNINDKKGEIKRLAVNGEVSSWVMITDQDQILNQEKERLVVVNEDEGNVIFRKPLAQSMITFRIKNDAIEFIKENTGVTRQKGALVTMALNKNTMSFVDLDRTLNVDITIPTSETFFDMNQIQISSYQYPMVVLAYTDRDQDLYYPVLVDLEKKTWTRIAPSITEKTVVLWSDAGLKKALIQAKFNEEFPDLYAVNWTAEGVSNVQKLSNLLLGTRISGDTVYFIEGTGGVWDQNPKTKLYSWDKKLNTITGPLKSEAKFLTNLGAYFSSDESGYIKSFADGASFLLPKDLLPEEEFCQVQTGAKDIFSYRFSSSYGDYSCMGGSLLKSQITASKDELVPQFSQYSWINKESLLDQRWQKTFSNFEVGSGLLISIGKNIGFWWSAIE